VIGKEIADALAPFAMWGALAFLVLMILFGIVWRIRKSAKIEERHEVVVEGQKEERDARKSIKDRVAGMRARLRARARRGELSNNEGGELSGPGGTVPKRDGPGADSEPPG
jgi:hypothetical protein